MKACPICNSKSIEEIIGGYRCKKCHYLSKPDKFKQSKLQLSKKAGTGLVIGIILGILFLGLIVTILVIANQKGWFDNSSDNKPVENTMSLFIKSLDRATGNFTEANYLVDYGNNIKIAEGHISDDDWTEIKVPNQIIHVYCWSNTHYLVKASKQFSPLELSYNSSKFTCDMVRIGEINVSHSGDLSREDNVLSLNISTSDYLFRPLLCASWTAGITTAYPTEAQVICPSGAWLNWSYYNVSIQQYVFLPQNFYRCGECQEGVCEWVEQCEFAESNKCRTFPTETPLLYKGKVDKCWNLGNSIYNSSSYKDIYVKMEHPNQLDKITFYIIDRDRRFVNGEWQWVTDEKGEDIGAKDYAYTVGF